MQNTSDSRIHNKVYNMSVLELKIVDANLFGNYTCRAVNTIGNHQAVLELREHPKPRKPLEVSFNIENYY